MFSVWRAARWVAQVGLVAFALRWFLMRLRRVLILPTGDTTPALNAADVVPMRRIVLSDIHLGAADRLDDFEADAELAAFVRSYVLRDEPTELILAGDTFEFLQVRLPGLGDYEWSATAAVRRLQAILAGHPDVVAALREFVARPANQLTLLIGNHDFELHYSAAKQLVLQAFGTTEAEGRIRFATRYEGGGLYLVHGNQFDEWNRFVYFDGISEPFEVVRGTRVVKDVINPMEDDPLDVAPLIDNVKPTSAFFWYLLSLPRLRRPEARRYLVRGLLLLFRTVALPRTYSSQPVLEVREELLGAPGETLQREVALQAMYELEPALQEAAAARHGGVVPEVRLRPRVQGWSAALLQNVGRRLARTDERSEAMLAELQQEAGENLHAEIREFADATQRELMRIAADPQHRHNRLFVCGHTHLAEVVPLNARQTYLNTGTWTAVVHNLATGQAETRRFPFLEITYPAGLDEPDGQLLVWRGTGEAPVSWQRAGSESILN